MRKATYVVLICQLENYNRLTYSTAEEAMIEYINVIKYYCYVEVGVISGDEYQVIDRTW